MEEIHRKLQSTALWAVTFGGLALAYYGYHYLQVISELGYNGSLQTIMIQSMLPPLFAVVVGITALLVPPDDLKRLKKGYAHLKAHYAMYVIGVLFLANAFFVAVEPHMAFLRDPSFLLYFASIGTLPTLVSSYKKLIALALEKEPRPTVFAQNEPQPQRYKFGFIEKFSVASFFVTVAIFAVLFYVTEPEPSPGFKQGAEAYEKGDYASAFKQWLDVAENGEVRAQHFVGLLYMQGRGVAQNHEEAAKWFHKAAEEDDPESQNMLGYLYRTGRGVVQNDEAATGWYAKAAKNGSKNGQLNLADAYAAGKGVSQNPKEAAHWYRKAAEQGSADAQNELAVLYDRGIGVRQDIVTAYAFAAVAAKNGLELAARNQTALRLRMTREQIKQAEILAEEFYKTMTNGKSR